MITTAGWSGVIMWLGEIWPLRLHEGVIFPQRVSRVVHHGANEESLRNDVAGGNRANDSTLGRQVNGKRSHGGRCRGGLATGIAALALTGERFGKWP